MNYNIIMSKSADRCLRSIPKNIAQRIRSKLLLLSQDPWTYNNNVSKLVGREVYRLRVGQWRVIYTVEQDKLIIYVLTIGVRGGVYQ